MATKMTVRNDDAPECTRSELELIESFEQEFDDEFTVSDRLMEFVQSQITPGWHRTRYHSLRQEYVEWRRRQHEKESQE